MAIDIMAAFTQEPPVLDFVLPGFLAGTVGALVAPGSTGKSFWALEMAMSVACGWKEGNLLGIDAKAGDVVYLAGEDPDIALQMRINRIGQHLGQEARQSIADHLAIESVVGKRFDVMTERHSDRLIEYSKGKRLIVLDTLSRVHQLDENSNSAMAQLISQLEYIAKNTGAAILFLHHVSKNASREKSGDQQTAARGASSLIDNSRWGAFLSKMSTEEAGTWGVSDSQRPYFLRFGISKQNYAEPFEDVWLKRVDGGVLLPAQDDLMALRSGSGGEVEGKRAFGQRTVKKGTAGNPAEQIINTLSHLGPYLAAKNGDNDDDFF